MCTCLFLYMTVSFLLIYNIHIYSKWVPVFVLSFQNLSFLCFFFLQMCLSKNNPRQYTCNDCGEVFTQRSSLSRHRGSTHGNKKNGYIVCGRLYTFATNLNLHMQTHQQPPSHPNVLQQPAVDEFLVGQPEKTLSSDTAHTPYEYSTST